MEYTPNYSFRKPERRGESPDRADIEDLTANWQKADSLLKVATDSGTATSNSLAEHIADKNNPHNTTLEQLGGISADELDQRVAGYDEHIRNRDNPHEVTVTQTGGYTIAEIESLLEQKITQGADDLDPEFVVVTNSVAQVVTSSITKTELEALAGITGSIQEQLNNISFYNYLSPAHIITLTTGGNDFPDQEDIDDEVIPVIEDMYPTPKAHDAVIQNVQTQNATQRAAFLYAYFDGTQSDSFIGWRYITQIDTLINLADGTVNGVVRSSDDIDFNAGLGTVLHAVEADSAEAANGLVTIDLQSGADLHTLYDVDHNAIYTAGPGNNVANRPEGVDAFVMLSQRASSGHTLHVLYSVDSGEFSSLWTEEWNGSAWSNWKSPISDLARSVQPIQVTSLLANPNTWGFPGGITNGNQFPFYFNASATGTPPGWGTAAGSGTFVRQTAEGDGIIIVTRDNSAPLGNTVELAWKLWNQSGFYWSNWRTYGTEVGNATVPYDNGHFNALTLGGNTITEWPTGSGGGSGKKYATLVVGTTTAGHTADDVDYLCTGANDNVVIQSAIYALPTSGGRIVLLSGTYDISSTVTLNRQNSVIQGQGPSTVFSITGQEGINISGNNSALKDFKVLMTSDAYQGISISNATFKSSIERLYVSGNVGVGQTAIFVALNNSVSLEGHKIESCFFDNLDLCVSTSSAKTLITGCTAYDCSAFAQSAGNGGAVITNNRCETDDNMAIWITCNARNNIIANNTFVGGAWGIRGTTVAIVGNNITGNNFRSMFTTGINFTNGNGNLITGNTFVSCNQAYNLGTNTRQCLIAHNMIISQTIASIPGANNEESLNIVYSG